MSAATVTLQITEENGRLWAEVSELPGCFASGKDLDELLEAVNEAVALYLEDNPEGQEIMRHLAQEQDADVVVDFASRRDRKSHPRVVVKDIHADVEFDALIEA